MRIGLDGRFYRSGTGGIGRYTRELVKYLLQIDQSNIYILFITPQDVSECTIEAPNLKKIVLPIKHFTLAEQLRLPEELEKYNLDLMHWLNFNHPVGYRGRFVTTIHDLTMNYFPVGRQKNWFRRIAYLAVMRHAARASEAVIVPTETVKKEVLQHLKVKAEKIHAIYEGVETGGVTVSPRTDQLREMGITKPFLLFVSQWRPHKGSSVLVHAFAELKKQHDIQLVITGKPNPQFPEIVAVINRSPYRADIITPGFVDDKVLDALYGQAELFVFPSWYEGFGLPPLEAMARGLPVAASQTSVMPEVLGDGAAYFDPYDPIAMAKTIHELITDQNKRQQLIEKGLLQAKRYSWQNTAKQTLAVYENVFNS